MTPEANECAKANKNPSPSPSLSAINFKHLCAPSPVMGGGIPTPLKI